MSTKSAACESHPNTSVELLSLTTQQRHLQPCVCRASVHTYSARARGFPSSLVIQYVWTLTIPASPLLRLRHHDLLPQGEESERYPMEAILPHGPAGPGSLDGQDQHDTKQRRKSDTKHWEALIKTVSDDALMHKLPPLHLPSPTHSVWASETSASSG